MASILAHNIYPPVYFVNMKIFYELWRDLIPQLNLEFQIFPCSFNCEKSNLTHL